MKGYNLLYFVEFKPNMIKEKIWIFDFSIGVIKFRIKLYSNRHTHPLLWGTNSVDKA